MCTGLPRLGRERGQNASQPQSIKALEKYILYQTLKRNKLKRHNSQSRQACFVKLTHQEMHALITREHLRENDQQTL